jgi:hypothetical protein
MYKIFKMNGLEEEFALKKNAENNKTNKTVKTPTT